jgi:YHS domain-containing protein
VNSLSRIIRTLFSAILLGGIVSLLRFGVQSFAPAAPRRLPTPPGPIPLFRDPSCGTFVSPQVSFRAARAGRIEHFCSEQCRDRFLKSRSTTAGAHAVGNGVS